VILTSVIAGAVATLAYGVAYPRARLFGPTLFRGADGAQEVALTFDDGPHPDFTPRVLSILERHQVTATFFCVGREVEKHADLSREIVQRGHAVENHTYSHSTGVDLWVASRLEVDLRRAQDAIEKACGRRPEFYRPAVGMQSPVVHQAARRVGVRVVTWSVAARDGAWAFTHAKARKLASGVRGGDVIAFHDGTLSGRARLRETTLEALPVFLEAAKARGLRFATVAQVMRERA
jgi:peptidoglycan-N-acetylglucosamine deacetylase